MTKKRGGVAPLAGAGIEIMDELTGGSLTKSPLSQGRELKLPQSAGWWACIRSPLSQGRELKFLQGLQIRLVAGRPSRRGGN